MTGIKVSWETSQGKTEGRVVKAQTSQTKIKGDTVKAAKRYFALGTFSSIITGA